MLLGETALADTIQKTEFADLDIVPADQNLVATNLDLVDQEERELRLQKALALLRDNYDYIIIDCPPALDLLTLNALVASDSVLVPIQCEFFALEGISQLMDTIDRLKTAFNPDLKVEGVLLTMYDDRTNLTKQVETDLREFFGSEVFQDRNSTQYQAGGSTQLREIDFSLRSALTWRRGLYTTSKGSFGA